MPANKGHNAYSVWSLALIKVGVYGGYCCFLFPPEIRQQMEKSLVMRILTMAASRIRINPPIESLIHHSL